MTSQFSVQSPYALATLPTPLSSSNNGRYVVGEVYGDQPGSKKRKRAEVAVGIDGEGVNLYDVSRIRKLCCLSTPRSFSSDSTAGFNFTLDHFVRTATTSQLYLSAYLHPHQDFQVAYKTIYIRLHVNSSATIDRFS